jgi:hypothetical protein
MVRGQDAIDARSRLRCGAADDREPPPESFRSITRDARPLQERPQFARAVETNVTRLDPAEDGIGDARGAQIRARIADDEPASARKNSTHLSHRTERIGVMVERVGAKDGRERAVTEGKLLGIGDEESNALDGPRQLGRPSDHLRGEVHPTTNFATGPAAREAAPVPHPTSRSTSSPVRSRAARDACCTGSRHRDVAPPS